MVDSGVNVDTGLEKPKEDGEATTHRGSFRRQALRRPLANNSLSVMAGDVDLFLHRAVMAGDVKLVARLVEDLSSGGTFEPSALDGEGLTVMHQAVFAASLPVLDVLLRHGGNIDEIRDEEGCTLLHAAAMVGNCLLAGWLIKEGASVMVIDSDGQLPIDLADDLGMQELLLQAMHRAGYIGLALHYKSRLQKARDEGDDSDYGTASSMSSLTLGDFDESDDECDAVDTDSVDGDNLQVVDWQEECDVATHVDSEEHGSANSEKAADHTARCTLELNTKPSLAEGVITKSAIQLNFTDWLEGECFPTQGRVDSCVYTVIRPVLQLPRVEVLPTRCQCTALERDYAEFDPLAPGSSKMYLHFRMSLSGVLSSLQTSLGVHERSTTAASLSADRSGGHQADRDDNIRMHPVATHSKTKTMVPAKPAVSIRRSQTVSEADVGWVSGKSTPSLSSDAGCKMLLRRSMLSGRQGERRHQRPKMVSFPVEVLMTDAIGVGDVDEVRLLLGEGAIDINSLLPSGLTALHLAVLCRQRQIVQLLLTHGASMDCVDVDGWKPLHAAAREGTVPVTNALLENGADPFVLTPDGQTALALASNDNVRLVLRNAMERTLQLRADTAVDVVSMTTTPVSVVNHQAKLISCNDESRANVRRTRLNTKAVSFSPSVLLRQAIIDGNCEEVKDLLDESEMVIALNSTHLGGVTALHQAVLEEQTEVVHLLLNDERVDINLRDTDGWTALHAAAAIGATSIVELLLSAGASVNIATTDGQLALHLTDNDRIAMLLREHGTLEKNNC